MEEKKKRGEEGGNGVAATPPPPPAAADLIDLPALLDAEVHSTFLLVYSQAIRESATHRLNLHRDVLLGVPRIKQSIEQGYSPEMIGTLLDDLKSLQAVLQTVEGKVRDLALGQAVVRVATQYGVASLREDSVNLDSVRLQRIQTLKQEMIKSRSNLNPDSKEDGTSLSSKVFEFTFPTIDYTSLYTYVEEEKLNGNLAGDPAWELERTRRKTLSWRDSLQVNLKRLEILFKRTAEGIDWHGIMKLDSVILQALPAPDLISLILTKHEESSARLSAGPLPAAGRGGVRPIDGEEEGNICRLGISFRTDMIKVHKRKANENFGRGRYEEAEVLYDQAIKAGSNDASIALNRAAALLKLNRFEEAVACSTIALTQLDVAAAAEGVTTETTKTKDCTTHQSCERTAPMQAVATAASREELNTLRWKALVRRGKARKEMLLRVNQAGGREDHSTSKKVLLSAARADFAAAIRIDPDDEVPKQELSRLVGSDEREED